MLGFEPQTSISGNDHSDATTALLGVNPMNSLQAGNYKLMNTSNI